MLNPSEDELAALMRHAREIGEAMEGLLPGIRKNGHDTTASAPKGRARLVARMRQVADEEEAAGAKEIAADFRQRADEIEQDIVPVDEK
jgi:hypothetical protein